MCKQIREMLPGETAYVNYWCIRKTEKGWIIRGDYTTNELPVNASPIAILRTKYGIRIREIELQPYIEQCTKYSHDFNPGWHPLPVFIDNRLDESW